MKRRDQPGTDVSKWLDTPEGQKWSRNAHNGLKGRAMAERGVFGELKTDRDAEAMDSSRIGCGLRAAR